MFKGINFVKSQIAISYGSPNISWTIFRDSPLVYSTLFKPVFLAPEESSGSHCNAPEKKMAKRKKKIGFPGEARKKNLPLFRTAECSAGNFLAGFRNS